MKLIKEINGIEREFYFGLGFLGTLLDETDLTLINIDSKLAENPFKYIPLIMFHSLKFGIERNGKTVDFNQFDLAEWIQVEGGFDNVLITDFFNMFRASMTKNVPVEETKKKAIARK